MKKHYKIYDNDNQYWGVAHRKPKNGHQVARCLEWGGERAGENWQCVFYGFVNFYETLAKEQSRTSMIFSIFLVKDNFVFS